LVNLSKTGARVRDVLDEQLSQLSDLGVEPVLTTVLVGANDMLRRNRREAAVEHFKQLVAELPAGATVIATLPRRNRHALAINALVDDAAAAGRVRVADMRGRTLASLRGTRADDHFHPNEHGYASIADAFARALGLPE
jgi:lysophospholipase L1-like esterase